MNAVWGGYAVGVAGLVGFIPAKQCARPTARRIGQLQKFRILEVRAGNVLRLPPMAVASLAHARLHWPAAAGPHPGGALVGVRNHGAVLWHVDCHLQRR